MRTELLLNRIVLSLEDLVVRRPLSPQLVTIKPVVWELESEPLQRLLAAGAELDHRAPCLRFLL